MKLGDANLQVNDKNFTHPHFHTAFIFKEYITITFSKEPLLLWKCTSTISFRKHKRVTCNLPIQLQFLKVNFLYVEYAIGRSLEYSFCQIN